MDFRSRAAAPIGNNVGYDLHTTQNGLYSPYDAKVIGDYTGLTPPLTSTKTTMTELSWRLTVTGKDE